MTKVIWNWMFQLCSDFDCFLGDFETTKPKWIGSGLTHEVEKSKLTFLLQKKTRKTWEMD